jgi:hypothetical protein
VLLLVLEPDELLLELVAGFFCVLCVLELCAYPTATAAHTATPAIHFQPNPKPFVTTST